MKQRSGFACSIFYIYQSPARTSLHWKVHPLDRLLAWISITSTMSSRPMWPAGTSSMMAMEMARLLLNFQDSALRMMFLKTPWSLPSLRSTKQRSVICYSIFYIYTSPARTKSADFHPSGRYQTSIAHRVHPGAFQRIPRFLLFLWFHVKFVVPFLTALILA